MFGLGLGLGLGNYAGGTSAPAGTTRPTFDLTPAFLYQPETETGTTLSSGEVTAVTGIDSPNLARGTTGPLEMTDALGRKFWRFRGSDYLEIAAGDLTSTPRAFTLLAVCRHPVAGTCNVFGHSYQSDGVTVDSFSRAFMSSRVVTNSVQQLHAGLRAASTATGGITFGVPGAQLQVEGVACNASRSRFMVNEQAANGTLIDNTLTDMKGGRIGGYLKSNGTTNYLDLYAIVAFKGTLTDEQADAAMAALVAEYAVAPVTRQVVVEGDSIAAATASDLFYGVAALLGEPGSGRVAEGTRVVCSATSGGTVSIMETRKNATNGWPASVLPGGSANNVVMFQIGVNDRSTLTGAQVVTAISDYLGTSTTGALDRGFDAAVGINIAAANSTIEAHLEDIRTGLRDSAFLTGLDAQVGGANEGRVTLVDLEQIEEGGAGNKPFESPLDAGFYEGGQLHPNEAGAVLMVDGGDTPENAFASAA